MAALKLYLRRTTGNSASGPSAEQSTNLPNGSVSSPTFAKRDLKTALGSVQAAETLVHTHPNESGVHRDGMMRMFVSDALSAVTIAAGTWRVGLSHAESNGAADTYNNITVYIWRPGTGSKVGTIYDAHDGTGFGNELTDGRQIVSFSGGSVTCQSGDRIVFEWWHHWQHTMASAYTSTIRYDDGTELDDVAAAEGSWIECPQDDLFSAAAYSLDSQPGSFTLTGAAATPLAARLLSVDPGAYTLTGVLAGTELGKFLSVDPGSYAVAGAAATPLAARLLSVDPGAFAVTGVSAATVADRILSGDPGAYVLTGFDADLLFGAGAVAYSLDAAPGVYAVTGLDATLLAARILSANPASFALTGTATALLADRLLTASPGDYALTDGAASLLADRLLSVSPGAYSVDGVVAVLDFSGSVVVIVPLRTLMGVGQ